MSLLDDLKAAGQYIDSALQPNSNEIPGVLASVVAFLEHGDKFLKAVEGGAEEVHTLLAPTPEPEPEPAPAAPADQPAPADVPVDAPALTDEQLAAQIADLQAQQASRQATAGQTTVTHEPGASGVV